MSRRGRGCCRRWCLVWWEKIEVIAGFPDLPKIAGSRRCVVDSRLIKANDVPTWFFATDHCGRRRSQCQQKMRRTHPDACSWGQFMIDQHGVSLHRSVCLRPDTIYAGLILPKWPPIAFVTMDRMPSLRVDVAVYVPTWIDLVPGSLCRVGIAIIFVAVLWVIPDTTINRSMCLADATNPVPITRKRRLSHGDSCAKDAGTHCPEGVPPMVTRVVLLP